MADGEIKRSLPNGERVFIRDFRDSSGKQPQTAIAYTTLELGLDWLAEHSFSPISCRQNAELRIDKGYQSPEAWTGNFVNEGFLYTPYGLVIQKYSSVLDMPTQAAASNRAGNEMLVTDQQMEEALDETHTGEHSIFIQDDWAEDGIPTGEFKDHPLTNFLFGEQAAEYSRFLEDADIRTLPLFCLPKGLYQGFGKPFARLAIMRCLDNWSGIISSNADLHRPYGVRGVSYDSNESVDDISETYSTDQVVGSLFSSELDGLAPLIRPALDNLSKKHNDFIPIGRIIELLNQQGLSGIVGQLLREVRVGSNLPVNHEDWGPGGNVPTQGPPPELCNPSGWNHSETD